jgi:hypothetical protein
MSLIEQWRDRKRGSMGPTRPARLWKLVITLAVVVYVFLRLSRFG